MARHKETDEAQPAAEAQVSHEPPQEAPQPAQEHTPEAQEAATTRDDSTQAQSGEDFGQSEVQHAFEEAQEKGYFGNKVDPRPNSDHSLESGPESPSASEARRDVNIADVGEEK